MAEDVEVSEAGGGFKFRLVAGAIAAAALGIFVFQNTDDAPVKFLWLDGSFPLFLLLLITVGLTLILAVVSTWLLRRRSN